MDAQHSTPFRLGGAWRTSLGGQDAITSINPADGSVAGIITRALPKDVDEAVAIAWDAFRNKPWRHLRLDQRASTLYDIGRRLTAEREPLARLQMIDSGKPCKECLNMVDMAAGNFRYYAAVCETWQNEMMPARGEYFSMALAEPFGVVASITPWNSPIMNEAQKAAPALATGNAILIKPSEETPQLAIELARICTEAGLPEGLLTVCQVMAITGAKRSALFPAVPTVAEAGVPNYDITTWWGIVAPAGTPQAIVTKLNTLINAAAAKEPMKGRLTSEGAEAYRATPRRIPFHAGQRIRDVEGSGQIRQHQARLRQVIILSAAAAMRPPKTGRLGGAPCLRPGDQGRIRPGR
jgi:hypothetical protein